MTIVAPGTSLTPEEGARLGECAAQWAGTHRVHAGEWEVRYREAGEGPVLVLVHGLGCSADYWLRNGPALSAAGFRVLAPDLPGFGRTAGPRGGLTVPAQARAMADFAAAMRLPPAAYVGHSLSCQTAIELAAARPELVGALLLAAPSGDRRRKRRLYEAVGFARAVFTEPRDLIPWVAEAYLRAGFVRWLRTWWAGKCHDTFGRAEAVDVPALVLIGDRDPVVSIPFARALADALPAGRCRVVPGGAHAIIFDAADGFNRAVVEFLREAVQPPLPGG